MSTSLKHAKASRGISWRKPIRAILFLCLLNTIIPSHILVRAQTSDSPQLISKSNQGEQGEAWSSSPSMSADGRFVAYVSEADNLVDGDTNRASDVFVYDRLTNDTRRVSISSLGDQANAGSGRSSISANGRFVVFESMASNLVPNDTNQALDVFIHDRLTGQIERVSKGVDGRGGNNASYSGTVSSDGRYVAFTSLARNLVLEDTAAFPSVFVRDRWTEFTFKVSPEHQGDQSHLGFGDNLQISADGRMLAFTSPDNNQGSFNSNAREGIFIYNRPLATMDFLEIPQLEIGSRLLTLALSAEGGSLTYLTYDQVGDSGQATIYLYDLEQKFSQVITTFPITNRKPAYPSNLALSENGGVLLALIPNLKGQADLIRYDVQDGRGTVVDQASPGGGLTLAKNGKVLAYTKEENGINQIFVQDLDGDTSPGYSISGRVSDANGLPLGLVTITAYLGGRYAQTEPLAIAKTDQKGFYYLSGLPPRSLIIAPKKLGYLFTPDTYLLQIREDYQNLDFTPLPEGIIDEAKTDLGMPYSFDRGCDNPWVGCGGPFHGFSAGFCTDLVLDAYTWGADFSIQFALEQDFRSHPWHLYRWRDSRDAHDMWRYFSYSDQMLTHQEPYQPGDLVFFDWSEDGEIDHVALVSEVNDRYRPKWLLDASGVIDINPTGLAAELAWETFHERTVRGHARWSGIYEPVITEPPQGQILQMALSGEELNLQLSDGKGETISADEITIPGGVFRDLLWEQAISLREPLSIDYRYTVEIGNFSDQSKPFHLTTQTIQNDRIADRLEFKGTLKAGRLKRFSLRLGFNQRGELSVDLDLHRRKVSGKIWK